MPQTETTNKYCVYMHTFPNGKRYIGITGNPVKKRWKRGKNYRNNIYMMRAVDKYGWDNINHEVIAFELSKEEAEAKEREMIALYKSNTPEGGYNITSGGECIGKHSEETINKLREIRSWLEQNPEYKRHMSESHKGIAPPNKGVPMSEEQKRKISLAKRGCVGHGQKKVLCVETGIVYDSLTEAAEKTGSRIEKIVDVCKHSRHTTNGFHWEYMEE